MKKMYLIVALILATTLTFGQKTVTYNVGGTALFPITNSVNTKLPAIGETVGVVYNPTSSNVDYTFTASYLQSKKNQVQTPVLVGVRTQVLKNVYVGLEAGLNFYNTTRSKFTYSPSVTAQFGKFNVTQRFMSSIVTAGRDRSNIGVGVSYNLN